MKQTINTSNEFYNLALKTANANQIYNYTLSNSVITCDIIIKIPDVYKNYTINISFKNVTFKKAFIIQDWGVINSLTFNMCSFNSQINLLGETFVDFKVVDCHFEEKVNFSNSKFSNPATILGNKFLSEAIFSQCKFKTDIKIKENDFYSDVSFLDNEFKRDADFKRNSFRKGVNFDDSVFEGKFNGWGISGHSNLVDFSRVTFFKDSFLTQSHFFGGISLYAAVIKESLDLSDIKVYGDYSDSETLRIIKNFFLEQNNRIQAIKFHEKEMNAYRQELKVFYERCKKSLSEHNNTDDLGVHEKIHINNIAITELKEAKKNYKRDSIILYLNKITNNYGLSWVKALGFIFYTSIILYVVYILSFIFLGNYPFEFGWNGWIEFKQASNFTLKNYLQFLWPTHKFDFMEGTKSTFITYLIDIFSRIVIGFGIYQMIQAFRKFGKV